NGMEVRGGGLNNESTLTLRDCSIVQNVALVAGGGIFNSSTLVMSNCLLLQNMVTLPVGVPPPLPAPDQQVGAGVANVGTLTASHSFFRVNVVRARLVPARGGAIYNESTVTLSDSIVAGNFVIGGASTNLTPGALASGGGIFN